MAEQTRTVRVPIVERVLEANDDIAAVTRAELARRGIFSIDLIGAPGSGKTALLEATLQRLAGRGSEGVAADSVAARGPRRRPAPRHDVAVLVGDLATQRASRSPRAKAATSKQVRSATRYVTWSSTA
jgi:predicted ATPase